MNRFTLATLFTALVLLAAPGACRAQQTGASPQQGAAQKAAQKDAAAQDAAKAEAALQASQRAIEETYQQKVAAEMAELNRDAVALAEQEAAAAREQAARMPAVVDAAEVDVRYVRTGGVPARTAASMLQAQAQRHFFVRAADGSVSGPYMNIDSFGEDVVVLHDRREALDQLQAALEKFVEVSAASPRAQVIRTADLGTVEYRPRHESVDTLMRALEPLMRRIPTGAVDPNGNTSYANNLSILQAAGVLVLRDVPGRLAEMQAVLARIDVPAPQVMLTCLLVQEGAEATASAGTGELPADLVADLQQLLPVRSLTRIGQAALRVAAVPNRRVALTGMIADGRPFELRFVPVGLDRENGALSVSECQFELNGSPLFTTSAVIRAGEYVVLGASGIEPLFVVLRLVVLEG